MGSFERRGSPRRETCRPIKIHVVGGERARLRLPLTYEGFMKDLSTDGMAVYVYDGYNPLKSGDLLGKRLKIETTTPATNQPLFFLGEVRWALRDENDPLIFRMGLKFVEMTDFHLSSIKQLLTSNPADHNMLWNLWDSLRISE